ncbi:MAG: YfhO family protein [Lachnospiraceae bacterium]|nr:YfhO family protein [Lachnospiraceae bacterium]
MEENIKVKSLINNIVAFLIPVTIMTVICLKYGFFPFGDKSILMADMRYQFVDYYGYLKNILFSNDDILYTFSKTFGGDMAGLLAYYCNAPFVLLLAFVPTEYLPGGILIIMILMIGLASLNFNIMLNRIFGLRWGSVIFSISYAFTGYLMGYFNCTQYFFNIMLMPLFILGLTEIIDNGRMSILYIVTLALSIFSNYYIGYMECLFSIMFFVYYYLTKYTEVEDIKGNLRTVFIYIYNSAIGVGISSVSLLCAIFSLQGQKNSKLGSVFSFLLNFNILDLFSGFYNSAFYGNVSDGLPLIYSGVIATAMGVLFYFNKKISLREKILSAIVFVILILSFLIDGFSVVWHGFAHPIGFPYRNSFLVSFFLIYIAYRCFLNIAEGLRKLHLIVFMAGYFLYSAYLLLTGNAYVGKLQFAITTVILIATVAEIRFCREGKKYMIPIVAGFFVIGIADASINAYNSIGAYFPDFNETDDYDMSKYQDFVYETGGIVDAIKERDDGLYRIEKLYRRSNNDAMLLGYNGLSHFSSCENDVAKNFMGSLGFRNSKTWAYYGYGSTGFADSIMGVRYVISQFDEHSKPYPRILDMGTKFVYENLHVLPFGFVMEDRAIDLDPERSRDLFYYQNEIASAFTGKWYDIYKPAKDIEISLHNAEEIKEDTYRVIDPDDEACIELSFIAENTDFVYMHFDADDFQDIKITANDLEKEPYFTNYGWAIRAMGHYQPGETVSVKLILNQDEVTLTDYDFYYEDQDELSRWYYDAVSSPVSVEKIKSSHLKGDLTVNKEDGYLVFSIPYDENWKLYIDGKRAETVNIMNGLLASRVKGGDHKYEMKYIPRGIIVGTPVSLISFIIFIVLSVRDINLRKKEKNTVDGDETDKL